MMVVIRCKERDRARVEIYFPFFSFFLRTSSSSANLDSILAFFFFFFFFSASSTMTTKLRIGYVPEHFSLPILQLAESSWGQDHLELISQPSGTGQMLTSFHSENPCNRKIDVAIALTEALIAGIAKGRRDYELAGTYVTSSLNW